MKDADDSSPRRRIFVLEPFLFTYSLTMFIYTVGVQNLFLQKICSPEGPPGTDEVCKSPVAIANAADLNTLRTVLRDCTSALSVLLAGAWRDRTGLSRPLIFLSVAGDIVGVAIDLVASIYWDSSSWLMAGLEGAVASLTGGKQVVFMATNCYLTEVTSAEERTIRLTYSMVAVLGGAAISTLSSGYILAAFNYQYFFVFIMIMYALNIALAMFSIKESPKEKKPQKGFIDFGKLKAAFSTGPNRKQIWLMLTAYTFLATAIIGEMSVVLYFLEEGFTYSVKKAGIYNSFKLAVSIVGTVSITPLLSKCFKWTDYTTCVFTSILSIVVWVWTALVNTELGLILVSALSWAPPICISVTKAAMTKLFVDDEAGIFFSISTIAEAIIPLGLLPIYDFVFHATMVILPGAFYFLSAGLYLISLVLVCVTIWINKRRRSEPEKTNTFSCNNKDLNVSDLSSESSKEVVRKNSGVESHQNDCGSV